MAKNNAFIQSLRMTAEESETGRENIEAGGPDQTEDIYEDPWAGVIERMTRMFSDTSGIEESNDEKESDERTEKMESSGFEHGQDDTDGKEMFYFDDEECGIDNIITLNDETGKEVRFEFLGCVEYEDEMYVVLYPLEDDDGMAVILRVEDSDLEEESYVSVESEETLSAVFEIFKEKFKDEFDFSD